MRDTKSLETLEKIDYNVSKSEKAKGTQKRAAIGNRVFEPDNQASGYKPPDSSVQK
ncbi:hypothetical protein [Microcoleus sp. AT9b-C2]|uniref:hypothetical protein n=1 Tax=Microcoleus sp. AT9b-C2 TaxID=2818628 RepID=UPI002FD5A43E